MTTFNLTPTLKFEKRVLTAFQIPDPDQLFIERLQQKLSDRFEDLAQSVKSQNVLLGHSQWFGKSKRLLSSFAWGAVALILIITIYVLEVIATILSGGKSSRFYQSLVREKGLSECFKFTGFQDRPVQITRALDIFVLPSLSEGLSSAILTAMACSLPVLRTYRWQRKRRLQLKSWVVM
jgi:hypothetical protein